MKKILLMLAMVLPMVFVACSDDEDKSDNDSKRNVTVSELESGTGTWATWYADLGDDDIFYVGFNNGNIVYADSDFYPYYTGEYTLDGTQITVTHETGTYELEVYFTTIDGETYLQINPSGGNKLPGFQFGSLKKSLFSLFD